MTRTQLGDFSTMLQVQSQRPQMCGEQIGLLRAAMDRIAAGTYGRCIRCHGEIGMVRLTALPHASFCIECQEDAFYQPRSFGITATPAGARLKKELSDVKRKPPGS